MEGSWPFIVVSCGVSVAVFVIVVVALAKCCRRCLRDRRDAPLLPQEEPQDEEKTDDGEEKFHGVRVDEPPQRDLDEGNQARDVHVQEATYAGQKEDKSTNVVKNKGGAISPDELRRRIKLLETQQMEVESSEKLLHLYQQAGDVDVPEKTVPDGERLIQVKNEIKQEF